MRADRLSADSTPGVSEDASRNEFVVSLPELRLFLLDADHRVRACC
jgi:hypothetical protein